MSDSLYGRGLYVFTGLSTDAKSPTSDPSASTWVKPPLPGQRAYETDTKKLYEFDTASWLKIRGTDAAGNPAGNTVLGDLLAGEDQPNDVIKIELQNGYELIAASQTAVVPGGGSGAIGDFLEAIIVKANTGTITVLDGATTVLVIPASTAVGTRFELNMLSQTAWKITTPASTEAICVGRFS